MKEKLLSLLLLMTVLVRISAGEISSAPEGSRPRELLLASLRFADRNWDETAGLLRPPVQSETGPHRTRESTWYALGLLLRDQPDDRARAVRIIGRVLDLQFDAPGQPWDGTFRRAPEEPPPGPGAELWKNYDPNWRQFIGTTFALMLEQQADRLPGELRTRMLAAIRRAVEGELSQGRAEPYHTNVKLMHAFLLGWAGHRLGRTDWVARSDEWIAQIRTEFVRHETFDEYNSPTYYGVDFYGLALCRRYGATAAIRAAGAELEGGLWREVGRFYHAGLKNMCGPFDRAYGMDLRHYVSLTGVWMGLVLPADLTPLPDPSGPMDHAHDFLFTPLFVALGAQVPEEVLANFRAYRGERTLRRPIAGPRVATAWLGPTVMLGGEITGLTLGASPDSGQFHPATAHWRVGAADVGWMVLRRCPPVDARAEPGKLTITTARGDAGFRLAAAGIDPAKLTRASWTLPDLAVQVDTDATGITVAPGDEFVEITYRAATKITLRFTPTP